VTLHSLTLFVLSIRKVHMTTTTTLKVSWSWFIMGTQICRQHTLLSLSLLSKYEMCINFHKDKTSLWMSPPFYMLSLSVNFELLKHIPVSLFNSVQVFMGMKIILLWIYLSAAFVVWAGSELTHLTSHLIKQVFMPQSSITMLAECVTCVRNQCDQVRCIHSEFLEDIYARLLIKIMVGRVT